MYGQVKMWWNDIKEIKEKVVKIEELAYYSTRNDEILQSMESLHDKLDWLIKNARKNEQSCMCVPEVKEESKPKVKAKPKKKTIASP